ncbi:MAG: ATP-dependent helicase HrpB [Rhodobacteraceae bacterium]|nr:ATP-dependent helicase HrpB [Paracoccaceae bacterium]
MAAAPLPVDAALPALAAALADGGRAVLQAPPGAGKTTRVPLALLAASPGRVLMLEPRRLAARAAAERMAATLGEAPGGTVGFRIRGEAAVSAATRIEVVTEGILTRMIQADPALDGVGTVIFDEFHERSIHADLGLALLWEARGALRPDLRLVVMSATLDAGPVAALLDGAPVVTAAGRAFPVETRWLDRPVAREARPEAAAADLVLRAVEETSGGILVFLPGEGEIRRVARLLDGRLPAGCAIRPLYGALPPAAQRAAIAPAAEGRKLVLATAIAETSLTIEDIRVVVDAGRARRARFDPGSGMTRLVTERVTRAEADQRRGRAGRVAPGVCYRLWTRGEEGALAAFPPPEIATADLAGLALELALWGAAGAQGLAFLTPPPAAALAEGRALLADLGALDGTGRITARGRAMAGLPLHPRLAHMLLHAGRQAAPLAALLADRDPLPGAGADLGARLAAMARPAAAPASAHGALQRLHEEAGRLARLVPAAGGGPMTAGEMAALAYPDRIGQRRPGEAPRFLLASGKGAVMAEGELLGAEPLVVASDLDGDPREARIRIAAPLSEAALRRLHGGRIGWREVCRWDARSGRIEARRQECLGALVLDDRPWEAPAAARAAAAVEGVRALGLEACGMSEAARRLIGRVEFLRAEGEDLPAMDEAALLAGAGEWLAPHLGAVRGAGDLARLDLAAALHGRLGREGRARVDRLAPEHFVTPLGRRVAVDYAGGVPAVALRLQELFGVAVHPVVGPRRLPLRLTLLSPAGRTIQVTTDLPGFWAGSYADVRKDMRGQYPKHPWPEDPAAAAPTLRARPRPTGRDGAAPG